MKLLILFGKSSNISLKDLDLTVIIVFSWKMMMLSLVGVTCDMRCISFHLQMYLIFACQTMSKHLVKGSAEQSWIDVKTIKNGKQANIGGESLEKRAILYTSEKLEEA